EDRFRFDGDDPIRPADERIPRAEIALDWQRDLGPPLQIRMEPLPQPFEQAHLAYVPNGISSRIDLEAHVEADRGSDARERPDVDRLRDAPFDPPFGRSRDPACRTDGVMAEPG